MSKYRNMLNELHEREISSVLDEILQMADQSANLGKEDAVLAEQMMKLWENRLEKSRKRREAYEEREKSVHLVFSLSDAGSLKVTLSKVGMREQVKVLAFNDLFSIGPIMNLDTAEGQRSREQWLVERFPHLIPYSLHNRDHQITAMIQGITTIPEHESITIWCGNNAHDQVGLYFVMHLLRNREQPVRIINLSEVYKDFAAGMEANVTPYAQGLIEQEIYEEIVRNHEKFEPLNAAERRRYESEWAEKLSTQEHTLRLWQDGKIVGVAEDELDDLIITAVLKLQKAEIDDGYVRAGSVITEVIENSHQLVGSQFLEYRIWRLISAGTLGFKGLPYAMFQYSVKVLG